MKSLKSVVVGALTAVVVFSGIQVVSAVTTNKVITACANKKTGVMRYTTKSCNKRLETTLVFNSQGVPGVAGAKGDTGTTGAAGAKGDTGTTGASGAAGAKGDTGTTGASGAPGVKGDTGTTGTPGSRWEFLSSAGAGGTAPTSRSNATPLLMIDSGYLGFGAVAVYCWAQSGARHYVMYENLAGESTVVIAQSLNTPGTSAWHITASGDQQVGSDSGASTLWNFMITRASGEMAELTLTVQSSPTGCGATLHGRV